MDYTEVLAVLGDVVGATLAFVTGSFRKLTSDEINDATRVYRGTIDYDSVFISDNIGLTNRAFTLPIPNGHYNAFRISLGPLGFASTGGNGLRKTLIHELCHVWQGTHDPVSWHYVVNSLANQAAYQNAAYSYQPGMIWVNYNAEQQATIVEDWYDHGCSPSDPLFPYIRNHIWSPFSSVPRSILQGVRSIGEE